MPWTKSFDFTDLDLSVLQGDSHIFAIDTTTMDTTYVDTGSARGGTYRDVLLSYSASRQDDFYKGCIIDVVTAGGLQSRKILSYEGATRTATVSDGADDLSPSPAFGNPYTLSALQCQH